MLPRHNYIITLRKILFQVLKQFYLKVDLTDLGIIVNINNMILYPSQSFSIDEERLSCLSKVLVPSPLFTKLNNFLFCPLFNNRTIPIDLKLENIVSNIEPNPPQNSEITDCNIECRFKDDILISLSKIRHDLFGTFIEFGIGKRAIQGILSEKEIELFLNNLESVVTDSFIQIKCRYLKIKMDKYIKIKNCFYYIQSLNLNDDVRTNREIISYNLNQAKNLMWEIKNEN